MSELLVPVEQHDQRPFLPRKGKIKIGLKVKGKNGKEYPRSVDYFICPPEVQKRYGEKPTQLEVIFPFNTLQYNFDESLKAYRFNGRIFCRSSDGITAERADPKTGTMVTMPCPLKACPFHQKNECKRYGILSFLIPGVSTTGVYQLTTSGNRSCNNIRNVMNMIAMHIQAFHIPRQLNSIRFLLRVVKEQANPWVYDKDKGEYDQVPTQIPVVLLELHPEEDELFTQYGQKFLQQSSQGTQPAQDHASDVKEIPPPLNDDYPAEHLLPQHHVSDTDNGVMHPKVEEFFTATQFLFESGDDPITEYLGIQDKDGIRAPTVQQVKSWRSEKEIKYLQKALDAIYTAYPSIQGGAS